MDPKNTIRTNLNRRTKIVDGMPDFHKGYPLPTWVELSLIDVCNRTCSFCPKSDPKIAPDTYQKMSRLLIDKLALELKKMKYKGAIALCGYGEPLLHKDILYITKKLSETASVEVVTNGDVLTSKTLKNLYQAKASRVLISMYDGPEQVENFQKIFSVAGLSEDYFILRDRWHSEEDAFGLKLTNRGGAIDVGNQDPVVTDHPCHYPAYSMTIDWNGDVLLCVQDWNKRIKLGNLNFQTLLEVWHSSELAKWRRRLIEGRRSKLPCSGCNTDGTLHGYNHVKSWQSETKNIS